MFQIKNILLCAVLALAAPAFAQTENVLKTISGDGLTENLAVPSGRTITISSGGILTIASGATIHAEAGSTVTGFGVAWGGVTGTLSAQTDLQAALNAKANLASPTFTGTVTIPSGASISGYAVTSGTLAQFAATTSTLLRGVLSDETGTGVAVFGTSPTITTPTISGAIAFPDGTRQTFNPNGTASGLNVGSHTADPSSLTDGDLWYNSTALAFKTRVNGGTVVVGNVTGAASSTDNAVVRFDSTTGKQLQNSGVTINDDGDLTAVDLASVGPNGTLSLVDSIISTTRDTLYIEYDRTSAINFLNGLVAIATNGTVLYTGEGAGFGMTDRTLGGNTFYLYNDNGDFRLGPAGSDKVRINVTSGSVGIGVAPTSDKLAVSGSCLLLDIGGAPSAPSGGAVFYSISGEMWVMDSSGNATQLSDHDGQRVAPAHLRDAESDQIRQQRNVFLGRIEWLNEGRRDVGRKDARWVETFEEYNARLGLTGAEALSVQNWEVVQAGHVAKAQEEHAAWQARRDAFSPTAEVPEFTEPEPEIYEAEPEPANLAAQRAEMPGILATQGLRRALAAKRTQMAGILAGLTDEQQDKLFAVRVLVENALDRGDIARARRLVANQQVQPELEPAKAQLLGLFPNPGE